MVWAFVIVLVLLIPVLAIVIDSQIGQALADRISSRRALGGDEELGSRLEALEAEVEYLSSSVESLQEESEFLRSLVEGPPEASPLPPGREGPESGSGS
ncbi:MAG: hypothetical protein ACE5HP_00805 [Gemmatimonadota bacterium]